MIIGYARVSREEQDLGRQIKALQDAGCQQIYTDKISGAKDKRPQLDAMLSALGEGDVVVVQKLDRLGRSLRHLIDMVMKFKERGVGFRVVDGSMDTTTPQGTLVFHIIGAIAEFERELIRERTKDALAFKRSQGVRLGRPEKQEPELEFKFKQLDIAGFDREGICRTLDIKQWKYYALKNKQVV